MGLREMVRLDGKSVILVIFPNLVFILGKKLKMEYFEEKIKIYSE